VRLQGLEAFKDTYHAAGPDALGLYLGAGVNLHPEGKQASGLRYRTYCWGQFLEELYKRNQGELTGSYADLRGRYGDDWQGLASAVVGSLQLKQFVEQIDQLLYEGLPRSDRDSRLSKRLLDQAPTLRAVLCFSTRIRRRTARSFTFRRNPKVGTVITTNYDFFFGAGWTRYQAFQRQWKVQTPASERDPTPGQGTICYIHGYVPYKLRAKRDLVLTRESYAAAYAADGFATRTLRQAIDGHTLVFVGTSFEDVPLCEALAASRNRDRHFALVRAGSEAAQRADRLGLRLVVVEDYWRVAEVLKKVYCADLSRDEIDRVGLKSAHAYWERLKEGPIK
jgi:hypothetical protein